MTSFASDSVVVNVQQACALLRVNKSTIKRRLDRGEYGFSKVRGNGGEQYRIELATLPVEAQHRYLAQQLTAAHAPRDRRAALQQLNLDEQTANEVARAAGIVRKPRPAQPLPLTADESHAARLKFEQLCGSAQEEGHHRALIMNKLAQCEASAPMMERYRITAEDSGQSIDTLRRWHAVVRHLEFRDWAPALAPNWGKGRPKVEMSENAWHYILKEYMCQSKPSLEPIYRRAKKLAAQEGWVVPSRKTVSRRIAALPTAHRVYLRDGQKALEDFFPALKRDYSTLSLHEMWCSDGTKADVFCVWEDGSVGRPIVLAWQELRSRKVLGWAIDKTESADLVRRAFGNAARNSNSVPESAYIDNGRAFASKPTTGGQATRNRFKIKADEPLGFLTMFGVKAVWATPYHGQAKPIESFWRTIKEAEKCAAFAGSYCGNRPDAKPEEFDRKKAIPIATYRAFVRETIEEKNAIAHRGDSMDGRSPDDLYAELISSVIVNAPTERQLHLCLMAVQQVRLDKAYGFSVHGNRYWTERCADLAHGGPYDVRYDAEDLSSPVFLYEGAKFHFAVPLFQEGEFRNQAAAKDHARAKRRFTRARREEADAIAAMDRAKRSWETEPPAAPAVVSAETQKAPTPKVVRISKVAIDMPVDRSSLVATAKAQHDAQSYDQLFDNAMREQLRRANSGK
jgi:putative transposase